MVNSKDKYFIFGFCTVVFLVSLIPQLLQSYFVHQSGKFNGIGVIFAIILISAILLKWKHTKILFNFVFLIAIVFDFIIISNVWQKYFLPHLVYLIVMIGLTAVFNFSHKIKEQLFRKIQPITKSI